MGFLHLTGITTPKNAGIPFEGNDAKPGHRLFHSDALDWRRIYYQLPGCDLGYGSGENARKPEVVLRSYHDDRYLLGKNGIKDLQHITQPK
jgi:hypothetical protein